MNKSTDNKRKGSAMSDKKSPFRKAKRQNLKLKMILAGPSGSGKTYSALQLIQGFDNTDKWFDKTVVIDTEDSADIYDRFGSYTVMDFKQPFDPRRLEKAIDMCVEEGFEYIIIDSLTKMWDGPGGALDIHTKFGGKFQDWSKVTPIWDSMLQKIVHCPAHLIATLRKKQDYAMDNTSGKVKVEKVGMKSIIREGAEYEVSAALDLNMDHAAVVNKDRTGIFEQVCPVILSPEHGQLLNKWCKGE